MKRFLQFAVAMTMASFISIGVTGQGIPEKDTLTMGPGYADDIFYSFKDGEVSKAARDTWDIAFFTPRFSAGIIINEGNGVELYSYPKGDTSAWASVDTTGMTEWPPMYNSPEYWEEGAFTRHALGHPDYGWGVYNQIDHSVYGDSIFVIKTPAMVRKLVIVKKVSVDNIYIFKFADLDGANEQTVELDVKPYEDKNFIYYSIDNNQKVDREPLSDEWDIQFTKYMDMVPTNEGDFAPYLVTGATNNVNVYSNNFYPEIPSFVQWSAKDFDSTKNAIGYDWKEFDMNSFSWMVKDSNYYFSQDVNGDIYRLQFKMWEGSTSGTFSFEQLLVSLADINEEGLNEDAFSLYPNPASESFSIRAGTPVSGLCFVTITDQTGRTVYRQELNGTELTDGIRINDLNLNKGLYLVSVKNGSKTTTKKLIVN